VQERVEAARDRQRVRFGTDKIKSNAEMRPADIRKFCALDATGQYVIEYRSGLIESLLQLQILFGSFGIQAQMRS
jgi:predicted ATPase with chaperone activity